MKKNNKYLFVVILFSVLFVSCYKQATYDKEPKIDFRKIVVKDTIDNIDLGNHITLYSIFFKIIDGDGNFGVKSEDTNAVENFFAKIYYLKNGNVLEYPLEIPLNGKIPYVNPVGLNDYYKAMIIFETDIKKIPYPLKLEFYVTDLDNNKSNIQTTPWIEPDFKGIMVDTNNIIID